MEKRPSIATIVVIVVLMLWLMMSQALACPYNGSKCKDCIVKQMTCGCPSCAPVMRCVARCLWGGRSRSDCIKSCDCGSSGNLKLSDCKKCMSKCKCSCMVY